MRRSLCALAFLALAAPRAEAQSGLKSYQILGGDRGKISLVDPHGNLVLRYPAGSKGKAILDDLRYLLKISLIG